MVTVFPLYLAVPLIAPPRAFATTGPLAEWLRLERSMDGAAAAFPSYHVIWAFLAAEALGRSAWQKRVWRTWAVLVSVSCVTTGMHAMVDVIAGVVVSFAIIRFDSVWSFLRNSSEIIANSWKEWRLGSARVINHGAYAAGSVFIGIWVIDTLLGPGKSAIPVAIFLGGSIGSSAMGASRRRLSGAVATTRFLRRNAGHVRGWNRRGMGEADQHLAGSGGAGCVRALDSRHWTFALSGARLLSRTPRLR